MVTCNICNEEFKKLKSLTTHVNAKHKLNGREYYDKYLKKEDDGKCVVCGDQTTYRNVSVGYLRTCSIKCRNKNVEYRIKNSTSKKSKKQSKEHIGKRIKNTNQKKKELSRKNTMLSKYGVDNPSKIDLVKQVISQKNKGKKSHRTDEWQNNIIKSKIKNNTLKHTEETKSKISNKLRIYHSENLEREKYITESNNLNHLSGWYNGLYFRSSLELSFLVNNNNKTFSSCENNSYKVIYDDNGKQRVYYPDFTDGEFIYEIKPTGLLEYHNNKLKIIGGIKVYGDKYKVITEVESPYIKKSLICELISCGKIKLTKKSENVLLKYKF